MRKLAVLFVAAPAAVILACTWPRTADIGHLGTSGPADGNPVLHGDYPDPSVIRVGRDRSHTKYPNASAAAGRLVPEYWAAFVLSGDWR